MLSGSLSTVRYQEGSCETANYPGAMTRDGLMYTTLGLNGEKSELYEAYREYEGSVDEYDQAEKFDKTKKEIGDVLWYVAQMFSCLGEVFVIDDEYEPHSFSSYNDVEIYYEDVLVINTGAIAEIMKKSIRDAGKKEEVPFEVRKQLMIQHLWSVVDAVGTYADRLGLSLEECAAYNLEKLAERKKRGVLGGSGNNR